MRITIKMVIELNIDSITNIIFSKEFISDGNRRRSNNLNKNGAVEKSPIETVLNDKLNEVINEGILDSILPFICAAANLPTQSSKQNINHVCGLKSKPNANQKVPSPRNNVSASESQPVARSANENNLTNKDRHLRRKSNQSINFLSE